MVTGHFVAELRCPNCPDAPPQMEYIQTRLPIPPSELEWDYTVGSEIDMVPPEFASYININKHHPPEPLRLLESWDCVSCKSPAWAEVVIADDRVQSIEAVPLNEEVLGRVHYITRDLDRYFEDITGVPLYEGGKPRADVRERLMDAVRK